MSLTYYEALAIIGASRATYDEGLTPGSKLYDDASEADKDAVDVVWRRMLEEAIEITGIKL
jgi:hypothetical protein